MCAKSRRFSRYPGNAVWPCFIWTSLYISRVSLMCLTLYLTLWGLTIKPIILWGRSLSRWLSGLIHKSWRCTGFDYIYFKSGLISSRSRIWGELVFRSQNDTPNETNGVNSAVSVGCCKEVVQFSVSFVTSLFASFWRNSWKAMNFVFFSSE